MAKSTRPSQTWVHPFTMRKRHWSHRLPHITICHWLNHPLQRHTTVVILTLSHRTIISFPCVHEKIAYHSFHSVESGILPAHESTPITATTIPYALPSTHLHPLQLQPTIEYPSHPYQTHHQPHAVPHIFQPQLSAPYDLLRSLFHKQPANLIESYIPSSLLYTMQRNRNAAFTNAHILSAVPTPNFAAPTLGHPTHLFQQGSHQPGYNTIAYSAPQLYQKRSPKLLSEHPGKGNKKAIGV